MALGFGDRQLAPWNCKEVARQLTPSADADATGETEAALVHSEKGGPPQVKATWIGSDAYLQKAQELLDSTLSEYQKRNLWLDVLAFAKGPNHPAVAGRFGYKKSKRARRCDLRNINGDHPNMVSLGAGEVGSDGSR